MRHSFGNALALRCMDGLDEPLIIHVQAARLSDGWLDEILRTITRERGLVFSFGLMPTKGTVADPYYWSCHPRIALSLRHYHMMRP